MNSEQPHPVLLEWVGGAQNLDQADNAELSIHCVQWRRRRSSRVFTHHLEDLAVHQPEVESFAHETCRHGRPWNMVHLCTRRPRD
jgi:hypothetical protein